MAYAFKNDKSKTELASVAESGNYEDLTGTITAENALFELDSTSETDTEIVDGLTTLGWYDDVAGGLTR